MAEQFELGVVVPLYNKKDTVRRSVERLLQQTVPPAQVIVVDDGSSDGSAGELAPLEPRCTLLRQANAGPGAARNRGVALLRTEWVAFADADNLWQPDRLERVRDLVTRHPEVDWLAGRYWTCLPDGRRSLAPAEEVADTFTYFDRVAGLPGLHCSETLVVRRALFQRAGGFNERLRCYEITQLYLQLAAQAPLVGFVGEPTVEVFIDTPSSLYAEKRHSPAVLLAYAEELLALRQRFLAPPAFLTRLVAETLHECVYFACRGGEFDLARDLLRRHGDWLGPVVRWKARLRCLLGGLRGSKRPPEVVSSCRRS
jgi:glycosyltransferase involved in cell wall biosynthesis